jgi:phosphatidylcholine synthase
MSHTDSRPRGGTLERVAAWAVHGLTASGAVWALLALDAIVHARIKTALAWMVLAVVVDGVDGALARYARVKQVLPAVDGTLLDNLVDYLNYVVVPAFLLYRATLLPEGTGLVAAGAVCVAAAFQFCRTQAKTADRFLGFPSYWNVVAVYLLLLRPATWIALMIVGLLCVLSFVPLPWIYPTRTRPWRGVTLALTAVWALLMIFLLWSYPDHSRQLTQVSLGYAVYYVVLSLWIWRRGSALSET